MSEVRTVMAVVPHYAAHKAANVWLEACIASLLAQTIRPAAILVVDDQSSCPPDAVLERFPSVTLLRTSANVGPFAILDGIHAWADADALMHQDSDDWSEPDRLQLTLEAMRHRRAELVGCQISTVVEDVAPGAARVTRFPQDPRAALLCQPTLHSVFLSSALVSCHLVRRLGGFASGMRFSGDSEFIRRAVFGGVAINVPETAYVRRIHSGSLTRHPETGLGSPARLAVQGVVQARARALVADYVAGRPLDLQPLQKRPPIDFTHVLGPPPRWRPERQLMRA